MELRHIKELMAAMARTGTKRLNLKRDDFELVLERGDQDLWKPVAESSDYTEDHFRQVINPNKTDQAFSRGSELPPRSTPSVETPKEEMNATYITSPMVGTFYASPSPEDPSFVKVGDKIDKNHVVCIIEAMKVMNEIKANVTGVIAEILVESGQPVEFGTKLFRMM